MSVALTPAAGKLLSYLQFRDSFGPMYAAWAGRGRGVLVVTHLRDGGPLSRLDTFQWTTLQELQRGELVEVADAAEPLDYARRHLETPDGRRLTLRGIAKITCPKCGAQTPDEQCATSSGRDHQARPLGAAS